jgi:hypothetical protein
MTAISQTSFAQYANDAVRFSTFQTGSTSRIKAIGNASTAVGGDISSISSNPAGLGFFTRSEASFTPEFDSYKSNSAYLGRSGSATKNTPNLSNAGYVYYSRLNTPPGQDKTKGWVNLNFGVSYNRTNNFDERVNYGGDKNNANSINDYYANLANAEGVDASTLQGWALGQKLIDAYGTSSDFTYKANSYPGVIQNGYIDRTGGQNALDLALGTNYNNKLYLGFGIGVTNLRYKSTKTFNEVGALTAIVNNVPTNYGFNSTYSQFQDTKADGFNARLGIIYKIIESVRVGATITTPTFLTIDDSFSEGLTNNLSGGQKYFNGPVEYPLTYNMRTPFKASTGLSVFLGNIGFITGDVEYIDYSTTRTSSNDDYTNNYDNNIIKDTYRSAVNLHAGAEIKIANYIALRGGYAIQGTPLKTGGTDTRTVTGGLGYRFGSYYVDAAVMHITGSQNVLPYNIGATTPIANVNATNNNFFITFGYRY